MGAEAAPLEDGIEPSEPGILCGDDDEEIDHRDDLESGLVFAQILRRKNDALGRGDEAQSRDEELSCENKDDDPGGDETLFAEHHETRTHQHLVRERIHQFAEVRDEIACPGDLSVEQIGVGCDRENSERDCTCMGQPIDREHPDENESQGEPGDGELVGQIHAGAAHLKAGSGRGQTDRANIFATEEDCIEAPTRFT